MQYPTITYFNTFRSFYLLLVGSLLLGASNVEVACTADCKVVNHLECS